jgi:hypothetical protein
MSMLAEQVVMARERTCRQVAVDDVRETEAEDRRRRGQGSFLSEDWPQCISIPPVRQQIHGILWFFL